MSKRVTGDLSQLEGYWSGYLGKGKGKLFLILHILPVGDELWAMDLFSPDQSPLPIGASRISFKENQLEASWRLIPSQLKATVDLDKKVITGVWNQGAPQTIQFKWSANRPEWK